MATFTINSVGASVHTAVSAALTVTLPTTGIATDGTDLLLVIAGGRTGSSVFSTTPVADGFVLLNQGTSLASRVAVWGKIADGTETTTQVQNSGSTAQAFGMTVRVAGATWATLASAVIDNPGSTDNNLNATSTVIRFKAITPSQDGLCVVRITDRTVSSSQSSITSIAPLAGFQNADAAATPAFAFFNNAGSGILLAAEIASQGTAAAIALTDETVTTLSDTVTSACSQLAFTLSALGPAISSVIYPQYKRPSPPLIRY